ncbi:MAG TPA: sigma factor [Propionibacteriaceae bacterium]|nr:sigma factor [Propionibacteriaceae bacterium]
MTTSFAAISAGGEAEAASLGADPFGDQKLLNELLVASGRQDEVAFARFYQLTSPWIYLLLRRRTGSTTHAENAMRLVYTSIWRRAASFAPPKQSALAWATTIAYESVA